MILADIKKSKRDSGFTLVELLVSMAVFLLVIVAVVQIFQLGMSGAFRIFGRQSSLDAARFIMESVGKELRMSKINTGSGGPLGSLSIVNSAGMAVQYVFSGNNITRNGEALNPSKVGVTGAFFVSNNGTAQPRVTMVMKVRNQAVKISEQTQINLQTTISSRQYAP